MGASNVNRDICRAWNISERILSFLDSSIDVDMGVA